MTMMPAEHKTKQRFAEVDGLRGYAILAILMFHCIQHYNFPVYPQETNSFLLKTDAWIQKFSYSFLFGKLYSIFALFFGLSYYIQNENQKLKGNSYDKRFAWRMLLLLGFGFINGVFFPDGDILVLYSLVGIVMIPVIRLKTSVLVVLSVFFLLQPVQLYQIYKLLTDSSYMPINYSEALKMQVNNVIANGNFWQTAYTNFTKGQLASLLWAFDSGRVSQVLGLFICGIIAGRLGIFNRNYFTRNFWLKVLFFTGLFFLLTYFLRHVIVNQQDSEGLKAAVSYVYSLWLNILFTFIIIAVFVLLYNTPLKKILKPLTLLGRMSLTNYILQSIIGATLFFPYGLGLAYKLGITYSFILSIGIGILLILFSKYWLKKNKQGLLETFWYSVTWAFKQPCVNKTSFDRGLNKISPMRIEVSSKS